MAAEMSPPLVPVLHLLLLLLDPVLHLLLLPCLWSPALSRASAEGRKATSGIYTYTNFQTIRISSNLSYMIIIYDLFVHEKVIFSRSQNIITLYTLLIMIALLIVVPNSITLRCLFATILNMAPD